MNDSEVLESSMMSQHGEMTRILNAISCDASVNLVTLASFQDKYGNGTAYRVEEKFLDDFLTRDKHSRCIKGSKPLTPKSKYCYQSHLDGQENRLQIVTK